jgi:hypothetical protein
LVHKANGSYVISMNGRPSALRRLCNSVRAIDIGRHHHAGFGGNALQTRSADSDGDRKIEAGASHQPETVATELSPSSIQNNSGLPQSPVGRSQGRANRGNTSKVVIGAKDYFE